MPLSLKRETCHEIMLIATWGEWSKWGKCSKSCNGGISTRRRTCQCNSDICNGQCEGDDIDTTSCNEIGCVCDLHQDACGGETGLFTEEASTGKFELNNDFSIKITKTNKVTGEKLNNRGKILQSKALMKHRNNKDVSDAWLICKNNKAVTARITCDRVGILALDGKHCNFELPSCAPSGCDPAELEVWNTKLYDKDDGCKHGYFHSNGKTLEKNGNFCFRKCREDVRSSRKIKCVCKGTKCSYQVRVKREWHDWTGQFDNGKPFVKTNKC